MAQVSEDRVVVYSAAEKRHCAGLIDGFNAAHPGIVVDFRDGISVALDQRYRASVGEGRPEADVIWSSAMDLQLALVQEGHARAHPSPQAAALPGWAIYQDTAYATTLEPLLTLVNRDGFDPRQPAGSIGELARLIGADPARFRGRVASYDIERNGLGFLALLHAAGQESEFQAFIKALSASEPELFPSNPPLVDAVASGRAVLGYHVLGSYAQRAVAANPSLAIAATDQPVLAVSRVAFVCRNAPHPRAAERFVDFLLSARGQARIGEAGMFPIRPSSGDAPVLPGASLQPIRIDDGMRDLLDRERRRELLQRWRRAVAPTGVARSQPLTRGPS